jgi:hypothetical protein
LVDYIVRILDYYILRIIKLAADELSLVFSAIYREHTVPIFLVLLPFAFVILLVILNRLFSFNTLLYSHSVLLSILPLPFVETATDFYILSFPLKSALLELPHINLIIREPQLPRPMEFPLLELPLVNFLVFLL